MEIQVGVSGEGYAKNQQFDKSLINICCFQKQPLNYKNYDHKHCASWSPKY